MCRSSRSCVHVPQRTAQLSNAGAEILTGFLLAGMLVTPSRSLLQTFLYWQILRTRWVPPHQPTIPLFQIVRLPCLYMTAIQSPTRPRSASSTWLGGGVQVLDARLQGVPPSGMGHGGRTDPATAQRSAVPANPCWLRAAMVRERCAAPSAPAMMRCTATSSTTAQQ